MDANRWKGILGLTSLWMSVSLADEASLSFEPCSLTAPPLPAVSAECGTLTVSENPSGGDRKIDLAVARVPARGRSPQTDPVIFFAGGPGQAALEAYPLVQRALNGVRDTRDIVLMDQRGTGSSNPLDCPIDEFTMLSSVEDMDWQGFVEGCLDRLDADPRYYATRHAVQDVEAFRVALGVEQLNLVGGSYGTRMAMSYAQAHPERVRTMVLFGVVPQDEPLGASHAENLDTALDRLYDRCRDDMACAEKFGDVGAHLQALRSTLRENTPEVPLTHPITGEPASLQLNDDTIGGIVRLLSYTPEGLSLLPLLIYEAAVEQRYAPLAGQALMVLASLSEQISRGMELSVICSEDLPFFGETTAIREDSVIGDMVVSALREQCRYWPSEPAPAPFKRPLESDVPSLLISGEFDPVTPPRFGERAAQTLANARHLVVSGQGHNSLAGGCVPDLVVEFIESAEPAGLDVKCLDVLGPTPFFLRFTGPDP